MDISISSVDPVAANTHIFCRGITFVVKSGGNTVTNYTADASHEIEVTFPSESQMFFSSSRGQVTSGLETWWVSM